MHGKSWQSARELVEQLLRLAQNVQDPALLVSAHVESGMTLYFLGEFAAAREHVEQGIFFYDPQQYRSQAFHAGHDPGVVCLLYISWVLWFLGCPDQALKRTQEALTLAQEMSRPYNIAFALNWAATLHQFRREAKLTQERAEAAIALSTEQRFPQWVGMGSLLRGKALAEQGEGKEGIALMRQVIARVRAVGTEVMVPHFLALLAEAYGREGQAEEGLTVLVAALAVMDKTRERVYEAEVYRLKGELTLQQESQKAKGKSQKAKITDPRPLTPDSHAQAEACFLRAIAIARKQQAKSWELRATTSLARLCQQQGKTAEAHQMLSAIYGWFTEGFDTKDLQEAKALLDSLESRVKTGLRFNAVSS